MTSEHCVFQYHDGQVAQMYRRGGVTYHWMLNAKGKPEEKEISKTKPPRECLLSGMKQGAYQRVINHAA